MKTRWLKPAAGLTVGMLVCAAAQAEANPYYLGGSLGVNRASNVYRQPNTNNADTVTTMSLMAGVDQQIGRQHLVVDASLQQNRYSVNTPLDNHGYTLRGQFDWSTIGNVSGTLSASANQALASYNVGEGVTQVFAKNIERDRQLQSVVRVGLVTRYSLEASLTHYEQSFSLIQYDALAFSQNAASLGLVYRPHDLLRLGVALRHTTGEYPRYPVIKQFDPEVGPFFVKEADNFKRNDLDLSAYWQASGASKFDARLSFTKADHDVALALDFKGITGAIGWYWQPVSRLTIGSHYTHDTGNQNTALGIYLNRVGNTYQIDTSYELTAKTALTSSAVYNRGSYANSTNGASSYDNIHTLSLGARWAYSRALSLSCQINRTGRSASTSAYNYSANGYGCTAQALML